MKVELPGASPPYGEVAVRVWQDIAPPCRVAIAEIGDLEDAVAAALQTKGFDAIAFEGFSHLWEAMPALSPHVVITHNHLKGQHTFDPLYHAGALRAHRVATGASYPLWGATFNSVSNPAHPLGRIDYRQLFRDHFDFSLEIPWSMQGVLGNIVKAIAQTHPTYVPDDAKKWLL